MGAGVSQSRRAASGQRPRAISQASTTTTTTSRPTPASAARPHPHPRPRAAMLVSSDGQSYALEGALAEMALTLARHAAEIAATAKGAVELHWGPGGVQGRLVSLWDALPATPAPATPVATPPKRRHERAEVEANVDNLVILGDETPPWARDLRA